MSHKETEKKKQDQQLPARAPGWNKTNRYSILHLQFFLKPGRPSLRTFTPHFYWQVSAAIKRSQLHSSECWNHTPIIEHSISEHRVVRWKACGNITIGGRACSTARNPLLLLSLYNQWCHKFILRSGDEETISHLSCTEINAVLVEVRSCADIQCMVWQQSLGCSPFTTSGKYYKYTLSSDSTHDHLTLTSC